MLPDLVGMCISCSSFQAMFICHFQSFEFSACCHFELVVVSGLTRSLLLNFSRVETETATKARHIQDGRTCLVAVPDPTRSLLLNLSRVKTGTTTKTRHVQDSSYRKYKLEKTKIA